MISLSVLPYHAEIGSPTQHYGHTQNHLSSPPRSNFNGSSSESLNTERILFSEPYPKKYAEDTLRNERVSDQSCIKDSEGPHLLTGMLEQLKCQNLTKNENEHTLGNAAAHGLVSVKSDSTVQTIEEAIVSLDRITDEALPTHVLISILKNCRKRKDLLHAQRLHLHMCFHGVEAHGVLRNILLTIYVDSGIVQEAQQLVNKVDHLDEHSWNTLLQGYIESGNSDHAFKLYEMMEEKFVPTRRYILMALLKTFECLEKGQKLHAKIVKEGFEKDLFFCNTLIDMYLKTGCVKEAQDIIDEQPLTDKVLWSTLVNGYTELGLFEEALRCWDQILSTSMGPDAIICICILKICATLGELEKGRDVHTIIIAQMLEHNHMLGNALVYMYAKCGSLEDSQEVFNKLTVRDVVSWTSLITGYAEHERGEEALEIFDRMQEDGVTPNNVTFLCALKACSSIQAIDRGQKLHAEIVKDEWENHALISTALVDMYSKYGLFDEANFIHDSLAVKTVISWTSLIAGYAEHGLVKETFHCLKKMRSQGVSPNKVTYLCTLKACCNVNCINRGRKLHADIIKAGFEKDILISTTIVDMYSKCGSCVEAQFMFDRLESQNIISWTALIAGYVEHGHPQQALHHFENMQKENMFIEAVVYSYILKACGNLGDLLMGYSVHAETIGKGFDQVTDALVYMYAKNGLVDEAKQMFDSLQKKDVTSWNVLISSFSDCGLCKETISCLEIMELQGVLPDMSAWLYSLKSCHCNGFSGIGRKIHSDITKRGFETEALIGRALLDMYAMHDLFTDAWKVFDTLPSRSSISWSAIISSAC